MSSNSRFWADDVSSFITSENYFHIIPTNEMAFEDQLNAAARFSLYYSAVISFVKRDLNAFAIAFIVFVATYILHTQKQKQVRGKRQVEDFIGVRKQPHNNDYCYKPTVNNPFMNVSYVDTKEFSNRPRACNLSNPSIKKKVNNLYNQGQYHEVDDIFGRKTSSRQFYTNPITTIPNDQASFANWLYNVPGKTCKEGNGKQCAFSPPWNSTHTLS